MTPRTSYVRIGSLGAALLLGGSVLAACSTPSAGPAPTTTTTLSPAAGGTPFQGALRYATLPADLENLTAVTCVTAKACAAVGTGTSGSGATTSVGPAIAVTSDGGATWSAEIVPAGTLSLSGIACTSLKRCTAVGQAGNPGAGTGGALYSQDGGLAWSAATLPTIVTGLSAVTCISGTCFVVGTTASGLVVLDSTTAGAAWAQVGALPTGWISASAISCISVQQCWITAQLPIDATHASGVIASTDDGGATWTPASVPTGLGPLYSISCTARSASAHNLGAACTAAGTTSTITTQIGGGTGVILQWTAASNQWSMPGGATTSSAWVSVSCLTATTCAATGAPVAGSDQAGVLGFVGPPQATWRHPVIVPSPANLEAITCLSATTCVAVGNGVTARLAAD